MSVYNSIVNNINKLLALIMALFISFSGVYVLFDDDDIPIHVADLTGWYSPSTIVNDNSNGNSDDWANPSNAGSQSDTYADNEGSNAGSGFDYSQYLKCTNFNIDIGENKTVLGVQVEIDKCANGVNKSWDHQVYLVKGGIIQSNTTNKAVTGTDWDDSDSDTYVSYGGADDLWGCTLSESDVESSGFGVAISSKTMFRALGKIDHVRILISYETTNSPPNNPDVVSPNGESPTDFYTVGDTINITYNWSGDPNSETCDIKITAHEGETDNVAYYIQNRSITDAETQTNTTWWYNWNTTGVDTGTYHINITVTDPSSAESWGEQNGTFDIGFSTEVRSNGVDYFTWLGDNTTIAGVKENISTTDTIYQFADTGEWVSNNATVVSTFDVIKTDINDDIGNITINMSENPGYTDNYYDRTFILTDVDNGYNYTGFSKDPSKSVGELGQEADAMSMVDGEFIGVWDDDDYQWVFHVQGFVYNDVYPIDNTWDVCITKIIADRTWDQS